MSSKHPLEEYLDKLNVPDVTPEQKQEIVSSAVTNLSKGYVSILGFSGKKAAGKDTLAGGFRSSIAKAEFTPIAKEIKNEATAMFKMMYTWINNNDSTDFDDFAETFNVTPENAEHIYTILSDLLHSNSNVTGYNRENEVITVLQYLGKDVRQPQDEIYWTRKALWNIAQNSAQGRYSLVPDVRFFHDAEVLRTVGAHLFRLNISEEEQIKRLRFRDGVEVSLEVLRHPSETALDDYEGFHTVINTEGSSPDDVFWQAWNEWKAVRNKG